MAEGNELRLENQLCFPLYAAARLLVQAYKPYLDPLGLTYPQYLVMLTIWEEDGLSVSAIGNRLLLDSATLTPLLNKLERSKLIKRQRSKADARTVENWLSPQGVKLKAKAAKIPHQLLCSFGGEINVLNEIKPDLSSLILGFQAKF